MRVKVTLVSDKGKTFNRNGFKVKDRLGTLIELDKGDIGINMGSRWRGMPVIKLDSGKIVRGSECFWTKYYD
jgi:hypothetical protein